MTLFFWIFLLGTLAIQGVSILWIPFPWSLLITNVAPWFPGWVLFRMLSKEQYSRRVFLCFLLAVVWMGPFATIGALFALLEEFFSDQKALKEYQEKVTQDIKLTRAEKVYLGLTRNLWEEDEGHQIEPFVDIMKGEDLMLKQSVVDRMIQHPSPLSAVVLRTGLNDKNPDIRYYAASGLIQLNDLFQNRIDELRKKTKTAPESAEAWYDLGDIYDLYCFWKLPTSDSIEGFLDEAQSCYQKSLALNPDDSDVCCALGRLLLKRRRMAAAIEVLKGGFERNPDSTAFLGWLAEAFYVSKRFDELAKLTEQHMDHPKMPNRLLEAFHFWANDTHEIPTLKIHYDMEEVSS